MISQLISVRGELCTRGYWNTPTDLPKSNLLEWFAAQIEEIGLSDVKSTLYFSQVSGKYPLIPLFWIFIASMGECQKAVFLVFDDWYKHTTEKVFLQS